MNINKWHAKVIFLFISFAYFPTGNAGEVFLTPYKSVYDSDKSTDINQRSTKKLKIEKSIEIIEMAIIEISSKYPSESSLNATQLVDAINIAIKNLPIAPADIENATNKPQLLSILTSKLNSLNQTKLELDAAIDNVKSRNCPKGEWCKIVFAPDEEGFGDVSINPFGQGVDYKINALNYSMFLGDEVRIPFQIYFGEKSDDQSSETANSKLLLDPTAGIAIQLPFAYRYGGTSKGVCHFEVVNGHCIAGGDITLRYVELNNADTSEKKGATGLSVGIGASFMFPIFSEGIAEKAGHLSFAAKLRYYYHNIDDPSVLFGDVLDANGNAVKFEDSYAAASFSSEFAINDKFTIKAEYFSPLSNDEYLGDELNISVVFRKL